MTAFSDRRPLHRSERVRIEEPEPVTATLYAAGLPTFRRFGGLLGGECAEEHDVHVVPVWTAPSEERAAASWIGRRGACSLATALALGAVVFTVSVRELPLMRSPVALARLDGARCTDSAWKRVRDLRFAFPELGGIEFPTSKTGERLFGIFEDSFDRYIALEPGPLVSEVYPM